MFSVSSRHPVKRTRAPYRHLLGILAGFVLVLIVGDWLLAQAKLPRVYGSPNGALRKYEHYEQAATPADVVFIGCSYTLHGVSPRAVDAEVERLLGRSIRSYNLSSSANSLLTEYLLVRRLLERGQPLPKVVYLGISEQSSNACNHSWMANGLRALGEARDLPLAWAGGVGLGVDGLLAAASATYHEWSDCRIIAERLVTATPLVPEEKTRTDERGWAEWTGDDHLRTALHSIEGASGWYAQQSARFERGNPNDRALRQAITELEQAGVIVRLLRMPLSSVVDDAILPEVAEGYEDFLQRVVRTTDAQLVQVPRDLVREEHFFDPLHLGVEGAKRVSCWLAADVAAALREIDS